MRAFGYMPMPRKTANTVTETARPRVFYHGSPVAIHTLTEPCLDPKFARHQDEGDPGAPHVFVTTNRLQAKIFSLKVKEAIEIEAESDGGTIIFSDLPKYLPGGWLYTCPENPERPFRQLTVRGEREDKWVTPEKIPVTNPIFFRTDYLVRHGLRIYVLTGGLSPGRWTDMSRNAASAKRDLVEFYREQAIIGNLRLVALE